MSLAPASGQRVPVRTVVGGGGRDTHDGHENSPILVFFSNLLVLSTKGANSVWLASPGGNFSEALLIGRLIRALSLDVWAPLFAEQPLVRLSDAKNNTCASACFFLYVRWS